MNLPHQTSEAETEAYSSHVRAIQVRAEVEAALGCFEAAGHEGLVEVLFDGRDHEVGSLHDLVERRLMRVVDHLHVAVLGLVQLSAEMSREEGLPNVRAKAQDVINQASDTYRKRNGHHGSIEGDDGEKCWIVPFDAMEELRAALDAEKFSR